MNSRYATLALAMVCLSWPLPPMVGQEPDDEWADDPWTDDATSVIIHGFAETGFGVRLKDDPSISNDWTLSEFRVRLESERALKKLKFAGKVDLGYDDVLSETLVNLRELTLSFSPTASSDLKIGRQVLTWGTGDFVFLNDLFAKDFESFFSGRDDEYLKDAEAAVRIMIYGDRANWDVVWQPVFESDNTLDGERFSFFVPTLGEVAAPSPHVRAVDPARTLDNGEFALRVSTERDGVELAAYAHYGFFQQPTAQTPDGRPTFAPLASIGGSIRRPALSGLFNGEWVYYHSRDDTSGKDPTQPNSQMRALIGYERELARNLTSGFQYVAEWTQDYRDLIANSPVPQFEVDEVRHLLTSRLTYLAAQQKWRLSSFLFWSPNDEDVYVRGEARYRVGDRWSVSLAANLFWGNKDHTFFGQLERNDNIRALVRRSF